MTDISKAAQDVLAERQRQIAAGGGEPDSMCRFIARNGNFAQHPYEDREAYNLRVHGLREEDFE